MLAATTKEMYSLFSCGNRFYQRRDGTAEVAGSVRIHEAGEEWLERLKGYGW